MHANYLDTLDWGILIAYFLIRGRKLNCVSEGNK